MLVELNVFKNEHEGIDGDAFFEKYPFSFLLIRHDETPEMDEEGFRTTTRMGRDKDLTQEFKKPYEDLGEEPDSSNEFVGPICKGNDQNAVSMVTFGRAENNDMILDIPHLSKLHCFFKRDPEKGMTITDPGSSNGTTVNGVSLKRGIPQKLETGDQILFAGFVHGTFIDASGLFELLQLK